MTREEMLLDILIEECAEVIQRATKAKRFGLRETQPGQPDCNLTRILYECNDLVAVTDMLLPEWIDDQWIEAKRVKVEKYLEYSRELGMLK